MKIFPSSTGFLAAGLSLAVLLGGCKRTTIEGTKTAPASSLQVQVTRIHRGPITRSISLPANLRPLQQATLYAKVAGYLKRIPVDRGSVVNAGDIIAEIEAPELLADRAKFQAEADVARADFQRLSEALKRAPDLVVPLTVDNARSRMQMAEAGLKRSETLLSFTQITAPFSGVVTRRWADVGALIPTGTGNTPPQNAAIVTLMDFSRVRVEVFIPEPEAPLLKAGLAAQIQIDELPGKTFAGQVTRIGWSLDESTKTMPVEIELENPDRVLRPGMFATAKISVAHKPDAPLLPVDALVIEKAKTSVFLLVDGHARKTPVKVGFEDGKSFEVLDGVPSDAVVILTGKLALTDGQSVNAAEAK